LLLRIRGKKNTQYNSVEHALVEKDSQKVTFCAKIEETNERGDAV
jgi:hypothetical protein